MIFNSAWDPVDLVEGQEELKLLEEGISETIFNFVVAQVVLLVELDDNLHLFVKAQEFKFEDVVDEILVNLG